MPKQDVELFAHSAPTPLPQKVVLVAAAESLIRRMLQGVLSDAGYRVITASNSAEVIASCRENMPDLVLLDLGDPGRRDFALCATLRDQTSHRSMPVLTLADHGGAGVVEQIFKAGAADFLIKPVEPTLLKAKIHRELVHCDIERALQQHVKTAVAPQESYLGNWQYDPQSRLLYLSENLDKALQLPKAPVGQHLTQLLRRIHSYDRRDLRAALRRALHLGRSYTLQHRLTTRDGITKRVHHQITTVPHPTDGHSCLTGQFWSLTSENLITPEAIQAVPPFAFSSEQACQCSDPAHH